MSNTAKRTISSLQGSSHEDNCTPTKTPRLSGNDSSFKYVQMLDKRLEKQTQQIMSLLEEFKSRLFEEFDKRIDEVKSELSVVKERVENLETVTVNIKCMQDEIKSLKAKIKHQENRSVACDLRLNEIPYEQDENLDEIFFRICNTINISVPAIKTIYRLQNQNNKHSNISKDAAIIVKMWSPYDKNFFLKSLTNYRKINKDFSFCLRHIGFNSDNKFFVNENLTQSNFNLLRSAVRLKKKKIIHSAFSMRNLVYIKKTPNDPVMQIDDIQHLFRLFPGSNHLDSAINKSGSDLSST